MTLHQAVTVSLSRELCALMLMIASIQLMFNFNIQHLSLCDQEEYSTVLIKGGCMKGRNAMDWVRLRSLTTATCKVS